MLAGTFCWSPFGELECKKSLCESLLTSNSISCAISGWDLNFNHLLSVFKKSCQVKVLVTLALHCVKSNRKGKQIQAKKIVPVISRPPETCFDFFKSFQKAGE